MFILKVNNALVKNPVVRKIGIKDDVKLNLETQMLISVMTELKNLKSEMTPDLIKELKELDTEAQYQASIQQLRELTQTQS